MLQLLNDEALKLEKHPGDVELVRSIRRIVHTLKGDAAACGFRELSNTAHALEDALASESPSSHDRLAEVAFAAADTFGAMLTAYQRKRKLPSTVSLAKMIRELSQQPKSAKGTKAKAKAASAKLTKTKRSRKAAPAAAATIVPTESAGRTEPVGGTELGWTEYEKLAIEDAQSRGRNVFPGLSQHRPALPDADRRPAAGSQRAEEFRRGLGNKARAKLSRKLQAAGTAGLEQQVG